ncbi:AT hook, DNA-binding motif protein [Metarhizium rileyi]|uniref:AT hook, DNA-binding motif protein n=1 Tax=Metarhizium rileyi (strain RCEF 4871) TaxID=1649241 RepID=A0A167G545_METRR|nr:AT hook, DNA-binding motif protein [Metarhizium rileyi RCEF 4871]
MAPAVIADSDGDESNAASSPDRLPPAVPLQEPSTATTTTHPSGSTDPTFFKSIYDEHLDAANRQFMYQNERSSGAVDASSFDNGFQEIRGTSIHDKSPWDVPSSPEFAPPKPTRKQEGTSNARTKITRGLRRRLNDIGYVSQEDEPSDSTTQLRKKRRMEPDIASDDLVSTAPIEDNETFPAAPIALATSQEEQDASVRGGALRSPTKPLEQHCTNVMSSGTATNINTPKSNCVASVSESPKSEKSKSMQAKAGRHSSSSTGVPTPVSETKHSTKITKAREEPKKDVVVASDDESEGVYDPGPEQAKEDDGSDFEDTPRPMEKRKQRGRPKKADAAAPKIKKGKNDAEKNVKKKRGRPKKSVTVVKLDSDDEVQEIAPITPAEPTHTDSNRKQKLEVKTEQLEHSVPDVVTTESHAAVKPVAEEAPETPAPETKTDTSTSAVKKPAGKTSSKPVGGSGRPLYRVGLSKNTRIAPLLKIIRK